MILNNVLCIPCLILSIIYVVFTAKSFKLTEGEDYVRECERKALRVSIINAVLSVIAIFVLSSKAVIAVAAINVIIAILMFIGFKSSYDKFGNKKHKEVAHEDIVF